MFAGFSSAARTRCPMYVRCISRWLGNARERLGVKPVRVSAGNVAVWKMPES